MNGFLTNKEWAIPCRIMQQMVTFRHDLGQTNRVL